MKDDLLRKFIIETILDSSAENEDEKELDEFSGAGAVAGMSLPLGASPGKVSEPYVTPSRKLGNVKKNKK